MSRKRREGKADYSISTPEGLKIFDGFELLGLRGWTIGLHRFTGADALGCFHTHYGVAYRLILWGGYVEEVRLPMSERVELRTWFPGRFGKITHDYEHRIDRLLNGRASWTLWVRGPITHKITTRGC